MEKVIGTAGSNGKTSTKLAALCAPHVLTLAHNIRLGLPSTLSRLEVAR